MLHRYYPLHILHLKKMSQQEQEMLRPIIVGLAGKKGSGKDTVGKYLVDNYGFERIAFADALKDVCKIAFQLDDDSLNDPIGKETVNTFWNVRPRQLLQVVGEIFRCKLPNMLPEINRVNIWRNIIQQQIRKMKEDKRKSGGIPLRLVITDVRYDDEIDLILENGGEIWYIEGTETHIVDSHSSENGISEHYMCFKVKYVLQNNSYITRFKLTDNTSKFNTSKFDDLQQQQQQQQKVQHNKHNNVKMTLQQTLYYYAQCAMIGLCAVFDITMLVLYCLFVLFMVIFNIDENYTKDTLLHINKAKSYLNDLDNTIKKACLMSNIQPSSTWMNVRTGNWMQLLAVVMKKVTWKNVKLIIKFCLNIMMVAAMFWWLFKTDKMFSTLSYVNRFLIAYATIEVFESVRSKIRCL